MKKVLAFIVSMLLVLGLLTACGSNEPAQSSPDQPAESGETAPEPEDVPEPAEEPAPEEDAVAIEFDSHAYPDTDDQDYYVGLLYASNSSDTVAEVSFRYKVYDVDGNVMEAYDPWYGRYNEEFSETVFVPAGAKERPIGFLLAPGLVYNLDKNEDMPAADYVEYEFKASEEVPVEDLAAHFTPGELTISSGHLHYPIKFDQEIADKYSSVYGNYTILGYSNGEVAAVCCRNSFPRGTSSWSVQYAKDSGDDAFEAYHDEPYRCTWGASVLNSILASDDVFIAKSKPDDILFEPCAVDCVGIGDIFAI
jgi:hypothetical protein